MLLTRKPARSLGRHRLSRAAPAHEPAARGPRPVSTRRGRRRRDRGDGGVEHHEPHRAVGPRHRPARPARAPTARRALAACSCSCSARRRPASRCSARGYFRRGEGTLPGLLCLQYHLFLAAMGAVLLADDAYSFMVSWESMALTSYFLVTTQHRIAGDSPRRLPVLADRAPRRDRHPALVRRHAGRQLAVHVRRHAHRASCRRAWASAAFLLALVGFGAKAGLVPMHVWLPEAHPAAPSPVSALMSGVMLKTAVYGVLRVTFRPARRPRLVVGSRRRWRSVCSPRCTASCSRQRRPT